MKINIITYGCTANQGDSKIMESVLERAGHTITDFENCDYVVVNTCAVKDATENRIISKLSKLSKTNKKIIVGGCLTKISYDRIKKSVPNFHSIIDTRSIDMLPKVIEDSQKGKINQVIFSHESPIKPNLVKVSVDLSGIIHISEGCDLSCTYCATTIARGDLQNFSAADIVRGASHLLKTGAKEIFLTSQDNGAYNNNTVKLPELLDKVCNIDSDFFLRNGMTNPMYLNSILTDLINSYKNPKIYKFLHIPVQSGSNSVLKKMKRGYTVDGFKYSVSEFRKVFPKLNLSTDIIVGFPEETEEDFKGTVEIVKEVRFDNVNISKFGSRPGTEAAKMEQLDKKLVNRRSIELSKIARKTALEINKEWVDWKGKILVNELSGLIYIGKEKQFVGKNIFYKPVCVISEKDIMGKTVDVKITGFTQGALLGEIV